MREQHPELGPGGAVAEFTGASFYAYLEEHKLVGSRCQSCGTLHVPPRPICIACHGEEMEWTELSGQGKLVAFTTVHVAPTAMIEAGYGRENPYCVGIVQLDEGPAVSAQILGVDATRPEGITIGAPLRVVFGEPCPVQTAGQGADRERRTYLAFEQSQRR